MSRGYDIRFVQRPRGLLLIPQPHNLPLHIVQNVVRIRLTAYLDHLAAEHEDTVKYFLLAAGTRAGGFEQRARGDDDLDVCRLLD
jgi:hypothetical protein